MESGTLKVGTHGESWLGKASVSLASAPCTDLRLKLFQPKHPSTLISTAWPPPDVLFTHQTSFPPPEESQPGGTGTRRQEPLQ